MKTLLTIALLGVMVVPACDAQSAQRTVHHLSDSLTLVEHGDTLWWVRGPSDSVAHDALAADGKPLVMAALLKGESTYVLLRGEKRPMSPALATHVRAILLMAREEEAGRRPRPKPE